MHDDIVTLFNYHKKTGQWYSLILYGVSLGATHAEASNSRTDVTNQSTAILSVRCNPDKSINNNDDIRYFLHPKEYAVCDNPEECFTFTPGCDFFVEGAVGADNERCSSNAPVAPTLKSYADADYENGLYHAMTELNDGVYKVVSSQFFGLIPHFEIGGR